jgi:diaminohydroxyphosphoribosylaminopyrimidine deaminase / 5-amino-6-(5-phosphoribosylamino)uracil reductase
MRLTPFEAMLRAISEGHKGAGFVAPNPLVGCVILNSNFEFIAAGYHERVGEGHAEVNALKAVQDQSALNGAHIYVTLEPCAHEGRTPSCAKTLAKLPIASVTYGLMDPNPKVSGQGAEILRQAGKTVEQFTELQTELEELAEIFLMNQRSMRPFVTLKTAATLDGKIAMRDGTSQWITGEAARAHVQCLRGAHDAVLIGTGTFIKDNPRLNSRDPRFKDKRHKVVLLDPEGLTQHLLKGSALLEVRRPEDVFVVTHSKEPYDANVTVIAAPGNPGEIDLPVLMKDLYTRGMCSLLLEGGAFTYSRFLRERLVDRLSLYLAPKIIGEGISWTTGFDVTELAQARTLKTQRLEKLGDDIYFTGRLT